jgi:uncharacterized repeat protein (TIGR02543 family)
MGIINFFRVNVFNLGIIATIQYKNDESEKKQIFVKYGRKIQSPINKPGFEVYFKKTADTDSVIDLVIDANEFPDNKYTFQAEFQKKKIILQIIDLDGEKEIVEGLYDDEILYPQIVKKPGIRFEGYFFDKEFNEKFNLEKFPSESVLIFKKETEIKYPIRYSVNKENNNKKNPSTITYNQEILLLSPSLVGHKFIGWYENPKFRNDIVTKLSKVDYDVYLYAKFEINSYKIIFDTDDNQKIQSKTFLYNEKIMINETPKNKKGFTFGGWLYKGKMMNFRVMPPHDVILVANWNPIMYNIDLHLNYENKIETLNYNRLTEEYNLSIPRRKGYEFSGWYKDELLKGSKIYIIRTEMMKNISLYAKWVVKKYNIKLFDQGNLIKTLQVQEGKKIDISNVKLKRDGWVFNGWSDNKDKFTEFDFNREIYSEIVLHSNWGQYKKITSDEWLISLYQNQIKVEFKLLNSCDIMKSEYVSLLINIRAKARNINEEDFYFENSIESSNVWTTDRNLISNTSMKARFNKQIKTKDLKKFKIDIQKNQLMYYFSGNISNVMSVVLYKDREVLFKKELNFQNNLGLMLNNKLNKMDTALELSILYILSSQLRVKNELVLDHKQINLLDDFQKTKLEPSEYLIIDNLVDKIKRNRTKYLNFSVVDDMKKSIAVTAVLSDIRETLIKFHLMNENFLEKTLDEFKIFSSSFGFSFDETIKKISSNLKDSNIKLNLQLFGIEKNLSKKEKLLKINKIYLDFSKKIISSNKTISNKAKEVIKFLANERKKMEE